jgi:hypothetical protein
MCETFDSLLCASICFGLYVTFLREVSNKGTKEWLKMCVCGAQIHCLQLKLLKYLKCRLITNIVT